MLYTMNQDSENVYSCWDLVLATKLRRISSSAASYENKTLLQKQKYTFKFSVGLKQKQ